MTIDISTLTITETYHWLQNIVTPRPIGLVSTINRHGQPNLSPFSFFNLFSANPPVLIFSPLSRIRNNTSKHTLENLYEVPEAVIHMVNFDIVEQTSLASGEYERGVDEFEKAGFTKQKASIVRPPMVREARAKFETRVIEIKELGQQGGAGHLVICEVLMIHIDDDLLTDEKPDTVKMDWVARMGADYYTRSNKGIFKMEKPGRNPGVGFDCLPRAIRNSRFLSRVDLAKLASVSVIPPRCTAFSDHRLDAIYKTCKGELRERAVTGYVKELLNYNHLGTAWQVLLHFFQLR